MKNTFAIIVSRLLCGFILPMLAVSAFAAPIVRTANSTEPLGILNGLTQFTNDLGGSDNGVGSSRPNGYRVINWDAIQDNQLTGGAHFAPDYFNSTSPRGMVLSSACTNDDFVVSGLSGSTVRFGNVDPNYAAAFRNLSGQRLFSSAVGACNFIDVYFYVPGTKTPATVNGFALTFTDVDFNAASGILCFGTDGKPLDSAKFVNASNNGLSFIGVSYPNGERIAHVRIFSGTAKFGDPDAANGSGADVVVMDDFYYGEPRAIGHHSNDFDGDGTSDFSVFRPSNGTWYVLHTGLNTLTSMHFGQAGDIPVDGDFDGDARNDFTVFRPSNGTWYILRSSDGQFQGTAFGQADDKPVAGDYDKDGKTDIAVWRPANGTYYYLKSSNGQFAATQFGTNGDLPVGAGNQ